jgi:hypothetical protein
MLSAEQKAKKQRILRSNVRLRGTATKTGNIQLSKNKTAKASLAGWTRCGAIGLEKAPGRGPLTCPG